jgi:hypothetical protein
VRLGGVARWALAALVVAAGLTGILLFLGSRDTSTFNQASGPGQTFPDQGRAHLRPGAPRAPFAYDSRPPTSGPHVPLVPTRDARPLSTDELLQAIELGDVVLVYGDRTLQPALHGVASPLAGPFSRSLAAAGQAVVLDYQPGTQGVVAVAWRHLLRARGPRDPGLSGFIQYWLGRGAGA